FDCFQHWKFRICCAKAKSLNGVCKFSCRLFCRTRIWVVSELRSVLRRFCDHGTENSEQISHQAEKGISTECTILRIVAGQKNLISRFLYWLYSRNIKKQLQHAVLPQHIGMIIDGNRRWARQVGLDSAAEGYRAGARKMIEFLTWSDELKIPMVTLYLLSQDNLKRRPSEELAGLVPIIADLATHIAQWDGWKVKHVGSVDVLPDDLAAALREAEENTKNNTGMHINLAVGYGGRGEIVD